MFDVDYYIFGHLFYFFFFIIITLMQKQEIYITLHSTLTMRCDKYFIIIGYVLICVWRIDRYKN